MSEFFGIGTSGLLTAQRHLATTSHNISNVNTAGYTRQRDEQEARIPQYFGNGYVGTGVDVKTTVRLANEFLEEQIRNANSQFGKFDAFHKLSAQIDNIIANADSGLTPTLENFFSALQEANDNPSSTPARQVLLTEANTLTDRFKLLDNRFNELNDEVNQNLVDLTAEISDAARSIARLNADIRYKIGSGQGNIPNDLLDQREVLIKQISESIDISVLDQKDGTVNLFIGSGQPLVIDDTALTLSTQTNRFVSQDLDVILTQGSAVIDVTNMVSGGELQGVLDFKTEVLDKSRQALGRIAVAISEEINSQHQLGMTLQSNAAPFPLGGDFFTDLSNVPQVLPGQTGSTGSYTASIDNSRILTTSDYQLDVTAGGNYTLTRLDNNTQLYNGASLAALQTAALGEGFSIAEGAAPTADESYQIRPTINASHSIGVQVNNVLDIALAGPIVSRHGNDIDVGAGTAGGAINSGTGDISLPSIGNTTNIPLAGDIRLTFDPVNGDGAGGPGFAIVGGPGGNIAYDPATDFGGKSFTFATHGDITFELSGQPVTGDIFVIANNTSPYDDNRNGLLMSKLQTTKTLENSSTDFQSGYGIIVSDVGTKTHSASVDLLAQQTLSQQANADRDSYSGVNLDEEAANLLKFQQAYQASARVISVADEMFQTLIGVT